MLIRNNSAAPVILNLRDGKAYTVEANGATISLPDSYTALLDDNASTIALFNMGVLTALTDAGAPFPNFPTTVNAADSKAGRPFSVGGVYDAAGLPVIGGGGAPAVRGAAVAAGLAAVAWLGDSWFKQWQSGDRVAQFYRAADSSIAHACQLAYYGFVPVNAGVGGNTSRQMADRMDADVLAFNPTHLIIGATVNDPLNDVPAATAIANYVEIIEKALARGIRARIHNIPPTAAAYMNAGKWAILHAINRWINFTLPTLYPGISVCDRFSLCVDPTANPVNTVAGTYKDSLHYASALAYRIGKLDADWLKKYFAPSTFAAKSAGDVVGVLAGSRVISPYALMLGAGGTMDANSSGVVANGYRVQRNQGTGGAAVASVVPHDEAGNWQQVAITGASSSDIWSVGLISTISQAAAGLAAGGSYYFECEVDVANLAGVNEVYLNGAIRVDGVNIALRDNSNNQGLQRGTDAPYRKMLRTEVFTIPANAALIEWITTSVFVTFANGITAASGASTVKIARHTPVAMQ